MFVGSSRVLAVVVQLLASAVLPRGKWVTKKSVGFLLL